MSNSRTDAIPKPEYEMYVVILWKYPGWDILSPVITNLEVAKRTADLEWAKHEDYEQDVVVLQLSGQLYEGRSVK